MEIDRYQVLAAETAIYPNIGSNYIYPIIGLTGEVGEVADKIKKVIRDRSGILSEDDKIGIRKEMGDSLWYLAMLANELGFKLSDVAEENIAKIKDRKNRGVIHGAGDNR